MESKIKELQIAGETKVQSRLHRQDTNKEPTNIINK